VQCSCGAATESRNETKNGKVVTKYERCPKCGRVCVTWKTSKEGKK